MPTPLKVERTVPPINSAETTRFSYIKKLMLYPYLISYRKGELKMDQLPNIIDNP